MKHIVLCRIDDRLIHGQVVTAWVKQTEIGRASCRERVFRAV